MTEPHQKNTDESHSFLLHSIRGIWEDLALFENTTLLHTNIARDVMSGVVIAVIALPLALAFGVGSGLGAVAGLWGAVAGGIVGGFFGGSRISVSGPTGPTMVQLASVMVAFRLSSGELDFTAAFTIVFLSGLILVAISFLRIAKLIYFTPYSVIAGFMCGIGIIVILLQINPFLGLENSTSVLDALLGTPKAVLQADPYTLLISIPTLFILFGWSAAGRIYTKLKAIPAPLAALIAGTAIANIYDLPVAFIGDIPSELPTLRIPDLTRYNEFIIPAGTLAGLAILDSLLTCIIADNMTGERHNSDREVFSQGLSNMTSGLLGGLPTSTATMGTVANIKSGGKTPLACMTHGFIVAILILGLGPLAANIPVAALAAILLKVGVDILDYRILPVLHKLPATDMLVFWTVFIVTVIFDLLTAMGVGIVLAFFRFVQEVSKVYTHKAVYLDELESYLLSDELKKKIKVLKPEGPLFFGSIETLECAYESDDSHDDLIVDLTRVPMMDLSGAYALEDLILRAKEKGKEVFICNANERVTEILEKTEIIKHVGDECFFTLTEDAVIQAQELELVKSTYHQMVKRSVGNMDLHCDRAHFAKAAAYAHEAVYNEELRTHYGKGSSSEIFARAVEDYLVHPEIVELKLDQYSGSCGDQLFCVIKDNYEVATVRFSILGKDGAEIESGYASLISEANEWVYIAQKAIEALEDLQIHVEATDTPGNSTNQTVTLHEKR